MRIFQGRGSSGSSAKGAVKGEDTFDKNSERCCDEEFKCGKVSEK